MENNISPEFVKFIDGWIQFLLPILLAALVGFLAAKIGAMIVDLRKQMGADADSLLHQIVQQAVIIAEQSGLAQKLSGEAKKLLAADWVKAELARRGFKDIDVDRIAGLIEYYVYQLFTLLKQEYEKPVPYDEATPVELPPRPTTVTLPSWATSAQSTEE